MQMFRPAGRLTPELIQVGRNAHHGRSRPRLQPAARFTPQTKYRALRDSYMRVHALLDAWYSKLNRSAAATPGIERLVAQQENLWRQMTAIRTPDVPSPWRLTSRGTIIPPRG